MVSDDEFIEIDDNVFIHIVNGSPVHRGGKCYHSAESSRPKIRKERETNYRDQGLNYDADGNPFIFVDTNRGFEDINTTPKRSRARGASTSTPRRPTTSSARDDRRPTTSAAKKSPLVTPKATDADARHHHIPAGYSLKNWDPTESPILLLGSVFDANSLGKWIYDWTVFRHGPATPISDVAGELWLLLIKLAGKIKRAEEGLGGIRKRSDREVVAGFVENGEKLTDKLGRLLSACEGPMLKAGRRKGGEAVLGKNAGVEFVETLFGRERQLEGTERFMTSCRLWNMRFDANCEEILRNPTA